MSVKYHSSIVSSSSLLGANTARDSAPVLECSKSLEGLRYSEVGRGVGWFSRRTSSRPLPWGSGSRRHFFLRWRASPQHQASMLLSRMRPRSPGLRVIPAVSILILSSKFFLPNSCFMTFFMFVTSPYSSQAAMRRGG